MDTLPFDALGQGPPVVFLHCFPLDRAMWAGQLPAVASAHRRAYAVDLPGFGHAALPDSGAPSLDAYATAVLAWMDAQEMPTATLVGLSLGGYTALAMYRLAPERVRALVLADTRASADTPEAKAGRVVSQGIVRQKGPVGILDRLIPGLVAPGTRTALREEIRAMAARQTTEGVLFALLAMRDRADERNLLGRITVSTLVMVGDQDQVTPPAEMLAMAEAIPGGRYALVHGAGHLSNLERPTEFNRHLAEFLADEE